MSAIEEVLWNTFTSYTLNGNPKDPSRLNGSGLLKFCRDIMVLDAVMTEAPLTKAGLDLIYTSEIKSPKKVRGTQMEKEKSDKLDFEQFLSALIKIAQKCYPSAKTKDEAMQQLLMDNILPMAHKRKPVNISSFLRQPAIEALFKYYEVALTDMFRFYSASSDHTQKGKNMVKATSNIVKTFDDQIGLIEESKAKSQHHNMFSHCVGYVDFMRFCNDFSMTTSLGVTSLDIGDIYLSVLASNSFVPALRKIEFKEFWEAIVRCALVAFQDSTKVTTENKVKALFHYIWRNTQGRTQDHMISYGTLGGGGFNTYRGGLLKGTQALNERFVLAWTKDDYRDYLDVEGHSVLASAADKHHKKTLETAAVAATAAATSSENKKNAAKSPAPPTGPPPTPNSSGASSLMLKLLSGKPMNSNSDDIKSPVKGRLDTPSSSTSNIWVSEGDKHSQDGQLMDLLHDNIERRENFTVKTSDGQSVCVMIRDDDHVGDADGRIDTSDLRKLLYHRPDIALILYDCIVEEGIADPYEFESPPQSDNESGFVSPARSRTSSKVAFTPEVGHERDYEKYEDEDDEGNVEQQEVNEFNGDVESEEFGNGDNNEMSMKELDEMVDGMVEETEAVEEEA